MEEPVSNAEKQRLAAASMEFNQKEAKFRSQFPDAEESYKASEDRCDDQIRTNPIDRLIEPATPR